MLLVAGGVGGYAAWQGLDGTTTLSDSRSTLTVTVPDELGPRHRRPTAGSRPTSDATYPALSVGSSVRLGEPTVARASSSACCPAASCPRPCPATPSAARAEDAIDDDRDGDRSMTVYFTDCPYVTVERVVQVAANRLLWVQVRAAPAAPPSPSSTRSSTHGL